MKGVAAIVGCSNLISGGHDILIRDIAKEMLKRDRVDPPAAPRCKDSDS